MIECMQDAGKEDYLRPSERIGLDWYALEIPVQCISVRTANRIVVVVLLIRPKCAR